MPAGLPGAVEGIGRFTLSMERRGQGVACDGAQLVVSDGSARLHFFDPRECYGAAKRGGGALLAKRTVEVADESSEIVPALGELEFVDGKIMVGVFRIGCEAGGVGVGRGPTGGRGGGCAGAKSPEGACGHRAPAWGVRTTSSFHPSPRHRRTRRADCLTHCHAGVACYVT